jgi:hypothetical protein
MVVVALALGTILGGAPNASAATAPAGCTVSQWIGSPGYIKDSSGATVASVKQVYGYCDGKPRNWAYIWVWQSFIDANPSYSVIIRMYKSDGTWVPGSGMTFNQQESVSYATDTTQFCTYAYGILYRYDGARTNTSRVGSAKSSTVC